MVLKSRSLVLVTIGCIYVLCVIVLANRAILKLCLPSNSTGEKIDNELLLKFNLRLSESSVQQATLESDNTKFNLFSKTKKVDVGNRIVKSEEIILIDKKEYQDGTIRLDETKIKKQIDGSKHMEFNTLHEIFGAKPVLKTKTKIEKKKYLFALRYYEQLGMATKNFLSLASLATATDHSVVQPFVNNSRFSGLSTGVSYTRFKKSKNKFSDMDFYFDQKHLQDQMKNSGYSDLVTYNEFQVACKSVDVVVHFLYKDPNTDKDLTRWYKISDSVIQDVRRRSRFTGWTDCGFVRESHISQFLGNKRVARYVCVDPEVIKTTEQFQRLILKDSKCSAIVLWKGNGTKRTHFNIASEINKVIQPFQIKHSKRLIDIAYDYIRNTIKRPFISVHVRLERHIKWKGINAGLTCIQKLKNKIKKRMSQQNLKKIFLAHDLGEFGSDTVQHFSNKQAMTSLEVELRRQLNNPFRFDPAKYGLYDRGAIAIVEMHIMALGESLFTLGKGNFQQWVLDLFLSQNAEDKSLIFRVCELGDIMR